MNLCSPLPDQAPAATCDHCAVILEAIAREFDQLVADVRAEGPPLQPSDSADRVTLAVAASCYLNAAAIVRSHL